MQVRFGDALVTLSSPCCETARAHQREPVARPPDPSAFSENLFFFFLVVLYHYQDNKSTGITTKRLKSLWTKIKQHDHKELLRFGGTLQGLHMTRSHKRCPSGGYPFPCERDIPPRKKYTGAGGARVLIRFLFTLDPKGECIFSFLLRDYTRTISRDVEHCPVINFSQQGSPTCCVCLFLVHISWSASVNPWICIC